MPLIVGHIHVFVGDDLPGLDARSNKFPNSVCGACTSSFAVGEFVAFNV
ncbi:hypothetical protein AAIH70_30180 [Neorhizobium sp. BT27B]